MKVLKDKFLFLFALVLALQLISCSDDGDNKNPLEPQYTYIVSKTKLQTLYQSDLAAIVLFMGMFPDIAPMHNVDVYKIEYHSALKGGETVTCSGIVCVPQSNEMLRGVVSWQHGTVFRNNQAPSHLPNLGYYEPILTASRGYVGISNDYLGLGSTAGNTPQSYHIYAQTTGDWLCFMRAVNEFIETNSISTSKDMWLAGYSQGGYNATAAMKRWETENHDFFNLKEVYSGDGVYSTSELVDVLFEDNDYPGIYMAPLFLTGYNYYYDLGINNSDIYKSPYADAIDEWYNVNGGAFDETAIPTQIDAFFTDKFISDIRGKTSVFYQKLEENNLTNFIPRNKLYMFHSDGDEIIPVGLAEAAFGYYSGGNNGVELVKSANAAGHSATYLEFVRFVARHLK